MPRVQSLRNDVLLTIQKSQMEISHKLTAAVWREKQDDLRMIRQSEALIRQSRDLLAKADIALEKNWRVTR